MSSEPSSPPPRTVVIKVGGELFQTGAVRAIAADAAEAAGRGDRVLFVHGGGRVHRCLIASSTSGKSSFESGVALATTRGTLRQTGPPAFQRASTWSPAAGRVYGIQPLSSLRSSRIPGTVNE